MPNKRKKTGKEKRKKQGAEKAKGKRRGAGKLSNPKTNGLIRYKRHFSAKFPGANRLIYDQVIFYPGQKKETLACCSEFLWELHNE